ncbi:MAG: 3-hydroxyacyl-CoA dehydrogenase/enoyl-CoA hydratase family protein [Bacteroidia bacterium]
MQVAETATPQRSGIRHPHIRKVAVLGSGVMGSRIACHFANIGVEVLLLDIVPRELNAKEQAQGLTMEHPQVRNRIVNEALQAAIKGKPAPLYEAGLAQHITTGNFDDDLHRIADCDWILEAIVERLDIKQQLFARVDEHRRAGSIVTTNTSGIPIRMIATGRSEDFRRNFCGTHFFNPPRYLRLLEVIPGQDTDPALIDFLMHYGDLYLGKKTVLCNDTPAFIANRVGIYSIAKIFQLVRELGLTIEEVDSLTGPATGKPKTGTFRLSDLIGLDTTVHVLDGIRNNCPDDEEHALFQAPAFIQQMVEQKLLGDKTGQGFYKKSTGKDGSRVILSLDLDTLQYREERRPDIASLKAVKNISDLGKRLRSLFDAQDKGGEFVRRSSLGIWAYVSNRIPEIAAHPYQIDDAMCAGFGWDKGPFALWDMIGVEKTLPLFKSEGVQVANWVHEMVASGHPTFYKVEGGQRLCYDPAQGGYQPIAGVGSLVILETLREDKRIWSNSDASVIDLGDGVLNVEFHSKMNSIGEGIIKAINYAIDYAEEKGYNGVVIANEGENFSVGANIMLMLMMATQGEWDELAFAVRTFQNTAMRIRTSAVPVVVAPHAMTLGGSCEFTMHADRVVAAAETYIGLVEVGVGLIPGGGGTKEMALRASERYSQPGAAGVGVIQEYLMNIATAKVATSAREARQMHILRPVDRIVINSERRIREAKDMVLELAAAGYTPRQARTDIPVLGRNALSTLYAGIAGMEFGHYASAHDAKIARKVAYVLCGGDLSGEDNRVSEQYLLDIEREAFLSLCGEKKTLERMQHMLQTGKPLRN